MSKTDYAGIDYGMGLSNVDRETGIRFGVISANDLPYWDESSEPDYGKPTCPKCGNEAKDVADIEEDIDENNEWTQAKYECSDYACELCKYSFGSESAYGEEPIAWIVDRKDIQASQDSSGDVWILESQYFTYAQFCSPCGPGACYLTNWLEEPHDNNKAYCPPPSWFEDEENPPFPIYSVETGELIASPKEETDEETEGDD